MLEGFSTPFSYALAWILYQLNIEQKHWDIRLLQQARQSISMHQYESSSFNSIYRAEWRVDTRLYISFSRIRPSNSYAHHRINRQTVCLVVTKNPNANSGVRMHVIIKTFFVTVGLHGTTADQRKPCGSSNACSCWIKQRNTATCKIWNGIMLEWWWNGMMEWCWIDEVYEAE